MAKKIELPRGIWGDVIRGADKENFMGIMTTMAEAMNEDTEPEAPKWRSARAEGRFAPRRIR